MVTPAMLDNRTPGTDVLGTRPRATLVGGTVTGMAYGAASSPDLDINSDVRGASAAYPGHGLLRFLGGLLTGSSSFGGQRFPESQETFTGPWYNPGGAGGAYGGGWADGVLTVRDRHVMTRRGHVRNPDGGGSSMPSADRSGGPPMPEYQMVNTTESWQLGTDNTANQDNTGEHNWVPVTGKNWKRYPLGTQDGTQTLVMGPPPGEWREYGVRGGAGMHGPDPDIIDPNWIPARGAGGTGGQGLLVQAGAPGMQPADRRLVYGGVPHGLHSPTAPPLAWTMARQASIPQQTPPRVDRPASSKIAGQSMSQFFPSEGNTGAAVPTPRMPNPGRRAGLADRFLGSKT